MNKILDIRDLHKASLDDPEGFWAEVAKDIDWFEAPKTILDNAYAPHFYRWFADGLTNTSYNALDRHVQAGNGDVAAVIYDSPLADKKQSYSYQALLERVQKVAGMLMGNDVQKGDRVIIYMPMIPEALIAMLACARIGAIHSVVFGGFAANELATRIKDAEPKAILTANYGLEPSKVIEYQKFIDGALELAPNLVEHVFIWQREGYDWNFDKPHYLDWLAAEEKASPAEAVSVRGDDPLYILYTSGTTGSPKGVVRDNAGHMAALIWSMKNIYNVNQGDVYWAASDVGWVVGHSYIVYAPLLVGATTIMYEGKPVGTPDAGAFWRMIEEYKIKTLFTAPTAFRAIKKEDPGAKELAKYDLSHFEALFLAGERCDTDTLHWAENMLKVPVIDHWWQTETGWAISANCLGLKPLPIKPGSPSTAMVGYDVQVLDENHNRLPAGEMGDIAIKLPLPPSCLLGLWNADQRYIDSYLTKHLGYYNTGDAGFMDEDGYIFVMSRTDDIINVAGHRLSTGGIEEVVAQHPCVAEAAVVGIKDALKGQVPMGFVVLKSNVDKDPDLVIKELVASVRDMIGPLAVFKKVLITQRLPKTRSGKIVRGVLAKIADGEEWKMPATIDEPSILKDIEKELHG